MAKSNFPVEGALEEFTRMGLQAGFIVPTENGLIKSIMDAHADLRAFLSMTGVHDFSLQRQGVEQKRLIPATFVSGSDVIDTQISLYRPVTKNGDPRIWIYKLPKFAKQNDLVALIVSEHGEITIINCSDAKTWNTRKDPSSPFGKLVRESTISPIATQLLNQLQGISQKGFIASMRPGDTGVGFTLETLLGIKANSSRSPDFHGIEIKSGRRGGASKKQTLFSKVPNWNESRLKSAKEILSEFGYLDPAGRRSLYCSISSQPNPQGLSLTISGDGKWVEVLSNKSSPESSVVRWDLKELQRTFLTKHAETFWVKANVELLEKHEHFHYVSARHTRSPIASNLPTAIEIGKVQVDFLMHLKENGGTRDHGYLFRTTEDGAKLLFPTPLTYDLRSSTIAR